jgi:hypothetical protein
MLSGFIVRLLVLALSAAAGEQRVGEQRGQEPVACYAESVVAETDPAAPGGERLKYYYSVITREGLAKSPSWDAKSDNPPLSPREAMRLASGAMRSIARDTEYWRWQRQPGSVTLEYGYTRAPSGARGRQPHRKMWWWRVTYAAYPRTGFLIGGALGVDVLVLMDGAVMDLKERAPDAPVPRVDDTVPDDARARAR